MSDDSDNDSFFEGIPPHRRRRITPPPTPPPSDHSQQSRETSASENESADEDAVSTGDEVEQCTVVKRDKGDKEYPPDETPLNCYLVGIELFNFKSYEGCHIVGPFTDVTAIVGANGSGKSNLMDAISFALCMKSDKLRAKKVQHLVSSHGKDGNDDDDDDGNSSLLPPGDRLEKAYVKLAFRSRDDLSERTVTRRILSNNNSEYLIDQQVCRSQKQYMSFLARLGLDAKSKIFLLFQGTVDSLVTKNPKEFTRILEELSGSVKFAKMYNDLGDKCLSYEQKLHGLQLEKQRLQKSKTFLDSIRKQRDVNESIVDEIQQLKVQMLLLKVDAQCKEIELAQDRLKDDQQALKSIDQEIVRLEAQKVAIKTELSEIEPETAAIIRQCRQADLNLTRNEKHNTQTLKYKIKATQKKLDMAKKNKDDLEKKKMDVSIKANEHQEKIKAIDVKIEEVTGRLNANSAHFDISPELVDEFVRLKNEFQRQVANIEGYQSARDMERDLSFLNQKRTFWETQQADTHNEIASLKSSIETKEAIIQRLSKDISNLEQQKKDEATKAKAEMAELEKNSKKVKDYEEKLATSRETMNRMAESRKRDKKRREAGRLIDHLVRSYPGRVYGRFGTLCKPDHGKYFKVFAIVAGRYQNAIVVDSFATIQEIMQHETRSSYQSETFLALDTITAPDRHTALRYIREGQGKPLFDLLRKPTNVANIEKVIRFVVGNSVVCADRETARNVAYEMGNGITLNAISLKCCTYFKANGQISCSFGNKNHREVCDEEDYLREESDFKKLEKEYLATQEKLTQHKTNLEPINANILRFETHLNISRQHIKELEASIVEMNTLIEEHKATLNKLENDITQLKDSIDNSEHRLQGFAEEMLDIEGEVFAEFLGRFTSRHFENVKQFEAAYYNYHQADIEELNTLQKEREQCAHQLVQLERDNIEATIKMWEKKIKEDEAELQKLESAELNGRDLLKKKEEAFKKLLEQVEEKKEAQDAVENRLKKVLSELKSAFQRKDQFNKSIGKWTASLRSARTARHDLFRQAFTDATTSPFDSERFGEILANEAAGFEAEDDLLVDYSSIAELIEQIATTQDFHRLMFQLESELKAKEAELQTVTIGDDVNLDREAREARKKLKKITENIEKIREKLNESKEEFNAVKAKRYKTFDNFLTGVSDNLDIFYKEMTQNPSSQAFLMPENSEEPYLSGINFSCIAPGKTFQPMSRMSGGEKCLAAFAFIYSIYSQRLPSFFIMDEIDGPLDTNNILKLIAFIKSKSARTQFIFISHKQKLISLVDSLIGVTRINDKKDTYAKSKSFSLDLRVYDS